jgi:hypothetical protein
MPFVDKGNWIKNEEVDFFVVRVDAACFVKRRGWMFETGGQGGPERAWTGNG